MKPTRPLSASLPASSSLSGSQSRRRHLATLSAGLAGLLAGTREVMGETTAAAPKGLLLVTNKGDQTLSIIDPVLGKQIATVNENGNTGHELSASLDGKYAYVPIYGDSGVGKPGTDGQLMRVIDLAKREIVNTLDFGKGVRPHCAVTCAKTGLLYVTIELDNAVAVIDPATLKVIGNIPTGHPESHMLAVNNAGTIGYTANVSTGTVSVLDLKEKKLTTVIEVAKRTQRISVSPDDKWAFTSDQVEQRLVVINTATNKVEKYIDLPDYGYGTACTPDGKKLVIALPNSMRVAELDLETWKLGRMVEVPKSPQYVLMRPDGAVAYVSCDASAKVAAINVKDWTVEKLIDAGKTADGLAWAPVA